MDMSNGSSLACAFLTIVMALPVSARSPPAPKNTTNAFDGTYVGVSAENNSQANTLAGIGRAPAVMPGADRAWIFALRPH